MASSAVPAAVIQPGTSVAQMDPPAGGAEVLLT